MARRKNGPKKKKKIGALDCDGTIQREQTLVLIIKVDTEHRVFSRAFAKDFIAVKKEQRDRNISFETYDRTLIDMFSKEVRGKRVDEIERLARLAYEADRDWIYSFSKALIRCTKTTHRTIMITGALQPIATLLAPYWGIDRCVSTELEVDAEGRYTGEQAYCPVTDKRGALIDFAGGSDPALFEGSFAIGDTLSDLPMLDMVQHPIACNPTHALGEIAKDRGWAKVTLRKDDIAVQFGSHTENFSENRADDAVRYAFEQSRKVRDSKKRR